MTTDTVTFKTLQSTFAHLLASKLQIGPGFPFPEVRDHGDTTEWVRVAGEVGMDMETVRGGCLQRSWRLGSRRSS